MCWPWWMYSRSRREGRADAAHESLAFRSCISVRVIHVGGTRNRDQEDGSRTAAIWRVRVRMVSVGISRYWLAHEAGARIGGGQHKQGAGDQGSGDQRILGDPPLVRLSI